MLEINWNDLIRTLTRRKIAQLDLPLFWIVSRAADGRTLAEQVVEPALVRAVGHQDQDGEEQEGEDGLPQVDVVLGVPLQDDQQPNVGEDGEGGRDAEDDDLVDPARFAGRNGDDADGRDGQQVEGGAADDGAGAQFAGLKVVEDDFDDGEKDFRRARAQGHQGQVGHGAVPHGHFDDLGDVVLRGRDVDLFRLGGDLLDGAHENVRHDRDAQKGVEQGEEVQERPEAPRPENNHSITKLVLWLTWLNYAL